MKLKDCDGCLVYGTDNKPLSKARVVLDREKGTIKLYFKSTNLRSIRLRTYVDFYDSQKGLVRSMCELVIKRNSEPSKGTEPWMADCVIREVKDVFQRQKDIRMDVKMTTEFRTDGGKYFNGTIENISAGGIFLVTPQPIKPGTQIRFIKQFEGVTCEIHAKVLRVRGAGGGFGYGCQFIGLAPEAEAAIRKFVFRKQVEKQKKAERATT